MLIVLVKQTDASIQPDTPDALAMRRFLFESIDGSTDKDKKAWRRFISAMNKAQRGEYFKIKIERTRSSPFHKLVMAVLLAVFKAQETFSDFDLLRAYIKVGAGFVSYIPDQITGELRAIPRSQSFDDCSEDDARQFFDDMCAFLRSENCCKALWPQTPTAQSMNGMIRILEQFDPI